MTHLIKMIGLGFTTVLALSACTQQPSNSEQRQQQSNPASQYCLEQGGVAQTQTEAGKEISYCSLPDGRLVDQWELYYRDTLEVQEPTQEAGSSY